MPVVFSVTRARAVFEIGLLRLRGLGPANFSATATFVATGIRHGITRGAALLATATFNATGIRHGITRPAPFVATATLAVSGIQHSITRPAVLAATATLTASGIRHAITRPAGLAATAALRARASVGGDILCDSTGDDFIFSDGDTQAYVIVTL